MFTLHFAGFLIAQTFWTYIMRFKQTRLVTSRKAIAQLAKNKSKSISKIIVKEGINYGIDRTVSVQEKNCDKHVCPATYDVVAIIGAKYPTDPIWKKTTVERKHDHGDHFENSIV